MSLSNLALNGGEMLRSSSMPARNAFGIEERKAVMEVINFYSEKELDPSYDGHFEREYSKNISTYMGGGYSEILCSGTSAIYVALKSLELPNNSHVLVSSVTDAGSISPIILSGLRPILVDTRHDNFNIGLEQISERVTVKTSAILIVHFGGQPVKDINEIVLWARERELKVVEDCSQATGSEINSKKVGSFGDIAAWSTGSRKIQIAGGNGGVVYTKNKDLYKKVVAYGDRGKPKLDKNYVERDPSTYMLPGLNLKSDEISSSIGISSLRRLDKVRAKRIKFVEKINKLINEKSNCCLPYENIITSSPFFHPVIIKKDALKVDKITFANALIAEGIPLNPHYMFLCADWKWLKPYLVDDFDPPNARRLRDKSFNLFLNENYGNEEVDDIINAIIKVEFCFLK